MTTLQIIPKWKDKTAKFKGTIAAGEHVAVSIVNIGEDGDEYIQAEDLANLRLRVVNPANGKTLAQFPMPVAEGDDGDSGDAWDDESITPLTCELNLNTDRMLMAVPPGANVPLLFVLDAYEGATDEDEGEFTLYFKDMCEVTHWPRRRGEDEPTNLDDYKDLIEDFRERIDAAEDSISDAVDEANGIVAYVTAAKEDAQTAATNANAAKNVAQTAASNAADAKTAAETAQGKAEDAQTAAEAARDAINEPTDDFTEEGVAVDAKAVGDALDLKADKETTYTKTQTDTKITEAISAVKDSAPAAFDTLKEIADWIQDDQSGAAAMAETISSHTSQLSQLSQNKVDKVAGKGLSTNDYTTAEKTKLGGVETGAKDNVVEAAAASGFPQEGVTGKIYVAKDENKTYRWSGTQYVQIGGGGGGSSIDVVPPSTDPADAGKAADAKATGDALVPMLLAQYYPDGSVKSAAELTSGVKYTLDENARTATVKPFCYTGDAANDNGDIAGRVVIPPFVDAQGAPYLIDDGTRYKVVGVSGGTSAGYNTDLTAVLAPSTVASIGNSAFDSCTALTSVSIPSATTIGDSAFSFCYSLTSVSAPAAESIGQTAFQGCSVLASISIPSATTIGDAAFSYCTSLTFISLPAAESIGIGAFDSCETLAFVLAPAAKSIGSNAFYYCYALASVDFGATPRATVPTLGAVAFSDVPNSCKIIVPDAQYAAWTAETLPGGSPNPWYALVTAGYKFLRHSGWEHARRYELPAASSASPQMDGTASAGSSAAFARGDHVHPSDTSKQDAIADLAAIRSGASAGASAYQKPQAGIPSTDMSSGVQASLGKADAAVQPATLRYDLVTITTGQLQDRAVQKVTLNTESTTLVLPALTDLSGKVADFGIDVINAYAPEVDGTPTPTAASFQLDGTRGADYNLIVPKGETWSDMTALAAGEMAQFYFTLSAFQLDNIPTWKVVKQVVQKVTLPTVTP